jgi:hypothetical protein
MTYTENTKKATYKWRETHKEQHLKYARDYEKKNYEIVKATKIQKVLEKYYFKKELKAFLRILVD